MKKKTGFIIGGVFLLSLVLVVGVVMAIGSAEVTTAGVTVNSFLAVTLSNAPVTFSNMDPGTDPTAASNNPLTLTVESISNVNVKVETIANTAVFTGGTGSLTVDNMEWSITSGGTYVDYLITDAEVCATVAPGSACTIYHQLTIPSGLAAGTYSVGITITATQTP